MKQILISNKEASILAKTMEFLDVRDREQHECYENIQKIINRYDQRKPMKVFKHGGNYPPREK